MAIKKSITLAPIYPEFLYLNKQDRMVAEHTFTLDDVCYKRFPHKMHVFPTSFQATDCVIIDQYASKILLGKKKSQPAWRVCGGFVDPKDVSLEDSVKRERLEETGLDDLDCTKPKYLFSFRVEDPRYTNSQDKIMSAVFLCFSQADKPKAGDDINKLHWFSKDFIRRNYHRKVMPEHHHLIQQLIAMGYL